MDWYRKQGMTNKIVLPVAATLIVTLGILAWQIQYRSSEAIQNVARRGLAAYAGRYANEVNAFFGTALNQAQSFANAIESARSGNAELPRETVIAMLAGLEKGNPAFLGAGAAWEPDAFDGLDRNNADTPGSDGKGRFIPYVADGKLSLLEGLEESNYYKVPKTRRRTSLIQPFFYGTGKDKVFMTTASAALIRGDVFKGAVFIDIPMTKVTELVGGIQVYDTGWGAVVTQEGNIVAHKDADLINTSIFKTPYAGDVEQTAKSMKNGEAFPVVTNTAEGQSFVYYYPMVLPETGQTWFFMVCAPMGEVLAEAVSISRITIGISLTVLLLVLLVIIFIVRANVKPLGTLANVAREIAAGDLHVPVRDEGLGGEVKTLATALKEMIGSLIENIEKAEAMSKDAQEQTVKAQEATAEADKARLAAENAKREGMLAAAGRLENVVNIISSASEELSAQIEQSERGSSEQAARVAETATAMEEMNSTVMEVARNASAASDISHETRESAESGAQIVQRAVGAIQDVQQVSLALKEDMNTLAEQAKSITTIMGVISDIADQTNLLALNAAIEAARAGEAGRGFAVVADEVRKLAEKTMESTSQVGEAIKSVQESVTQSLSRVDRTVSLIASATEQANESGDALHGIVTLVDSTADQVRAIATASEEQSATSEEINRSISHINDIAEQTSIAMRDAAQAVSELARQAQELNRLMNEMKNS